jgi:hypothetical protein
VGIQNNSTEEMFYKIWTQENDLTKPTKMYKQFFKITAALKTEYKNIPI